jgi:hypothetical protein
MDIDLGKLEMEMSVQLIQELIPLGLLHVGGGFAGGRTRTCGGPA